MILYDSLWYLYDIYVHSEDFTIAYIAYKRTVKFLDNMCVCVCVNATPWWIEPTSCVQFCCCFDGARHHEASWMMAIPCLTKLVFQVASWSNLRKTWNPEVSGPCILHCFFIVPLNSQALAKHHCTPRISGSSRHHSWPKRRRNASVFCEDWTLSMKWICSSQICRQFYKLGRPICQLNLCYIFLLPTKSKLSWLASCETNGFTGPMCPSTMFEFSGSKTDSFHFGQNSVEIEHYCRRYDNVFCSSPVKV